MKEVRFQQYSVLFLIFASIYRLMIMNDVAHHYHHDDESTHTPGVFLLRLIIHLCRAVTHTDSGLCHEAYAKLPSTRGIYLPEDPFHFTLQWDRTCM